MANINVIASEKTQAYESLAVLNRSFTEINSALRELEHGSVFNPQSLVTFGGLTSELQALINHSLVQTLHTIEAEDAFRFGKVRIAWEHELNPERPAFNPGPLPPLESEP